jgi:hypothetical protein
MMQHGSGYDNDGYYIYSQEGEGIGSFLGSLFKSAIPVISRTIKAGSRIAAPHLKKAAVDIATAGSKRIAEKLSGEIAESIQKPKKKRRKRRI